MYGSQSPPEHQSSKITGRVNLINKVDKFGSVHGKCVKVVQISIDDLVAPGNRGRDVIKAPPRACLGDSVDDTLGTEEKNLDDLVDDGIESEDFRGYQTSPYMERVGFKTMKVPSHSNPSYSSMAQFNSTQRADTLRFKPFAFSDPPLFRMPPSLMQTG